MFCFVTGTYVKMALLDKKGNQPTGTFNPKTLLNDPAAVLDAVDASHSCDLSTRQTRDLEIPQTEWLEDIKENWEKDPQRQVRPSLIRWLCTSAYAKKHMDPQGITLREAWVSDTLDLYALRRPGLRIAATRCSFYGTVCLTDATILELKLKHCRMLSTAQNKECWENHQDEPRIKPSDIQLKQRSKETHSSEGYARKEYKTGEAIPQRLLCSFTANSLNASGGVRIRGSIVDGPVELNGCNIKGNISFEDSHLKRNAMGGDFYPAIAIDSGKLGHDLILRRTTVDGVVHLEHIDVKGSVLLPGAKITYKKNQPDHNIEDRQEKPDADETKSYRRSHRNALNFAGAKIRGDIEMDSAPAWGKAYESGLNEDKEDKLIQTTITGGLSLLRAHIGGSLTFCSAFIDAHYAPCAVNAIRCRVGGRINARSQHYRFSPKRTVFKGAVVFVNAKISNRVDFNGALIKKREIDTDSASGKKKPYTPTYRIGAWSLDFRKANIGGRVILKKGFTAKSGVCFRSAHIRDRVLIQDKVRIESPDIGKHPATRDRSIDARLLHIEGSINIEGPKTKLDGWADFSLARIDGKFSVGEYVDQDALKKYKNEKENGWWVHLGVKAPKSASREYPALDLRGATIASQITCGNPLWRLGTNEPFFAERDHRGYIPRVMPTQLLGSICADRATIGYSVELGCVELNSNFCDESSTSQQETHTTGPQYGFTSAADFTNSKIGEDLRIDGAVVRGGLCLDSVEIEQDLIFRCGLILSSRANKYLNLSHYKKDDWRWDKIRKACGSVLYHDRHRYRSWALALRHAHIKRTISLRSSAIFHGSLMIEATTAGGYFELCPNDDASNQYLDGLHQKMCQAFIEHEPYSETSKLSEKDKKALKDECYWPITWSMNLRASKLGVIYWSYARSGFVDESDLIYLKRKRHDFETEDQEKKRKAANNNQEPASDYQNKKDPDFLRSVHSLADMLILNDLTYDNIWFFEDQKNAEPSEQIEITPDDMMSSNISKAKDDWSVCRRFLHLQPLAAHQDDRRAHYEQKFPLQAIEPQSAGAVNQQSPVNAASQSQTQPDKGPQVQKKTTANVLYKPPNNLLDRLRPQPFEEFARACRVHGRQDLYLHCQVEKWVRITQNGLNPLRSTWIGKSLLFGSRLAGNFFNYLLIALSIALILLSAGMALCSLSTNVEAPELSYYQFTFYFFLMVLLVSLTIARYRVSKDLSGIATLSSWILLRLFGLVAGHGYRPLRIFVVALAFLILGTISVSVAHNQGIIRPSSEMGDRILVADNGRLPKSSVSQTTHTSEDRIGTVTQETPFGTKVFRGVIQAEEPTPLAASPSGAVKPIDDNALSADYPTFHAFWYAADLLIPVIGLEQAEYWQTYPYQEDSHRFRDLIEYQQSRTLRDRIDESDLTTGLVWMDYVVAWLGQPMYEAAVTYACSDYVSEEERQVKKKNGNIAAKERPWVFERLGIEPITFKSSAAATMHLLGPLYTLLGWLLVTMGIASVTRLIRHD